MKKILIILGLFLLVSVNILSQPVPVLDWAEYIGIDDDGNYYEGTEVEAALQEIGRGKGLNITYSGGYITSIERIGGKTITFTRNARDYVTSATDGTRTWTIGRDSDNEIVNITISE